MPLRPCSVALAAALETGTPLAEAELFVFTLADGVTVLRMCSYDSDLVYGGQLYSSKKPWPTRSEWSVTNTMQVPTLSVTLLAKNDAFNGGASIKAQARNGLFDGASFLLTSVFMPPRTTDTAAYGGIDLFGGVSAGLDTTANGIALTVKGKNNLLDQEVPRNRYQAGCNHAFCDAGCTLNRATYTAAFAVGAGPSTSVIPWGAAPANPGLYVNGTLAITGGAGAGQRRTIMAADASGLTLVYPLTTLPAPGDSFTAFQGCDKTFDSGSGQSCTDRGNTQHYRGFEFIPPPNAAV